MKSATLLVLIHLASPAGAWRFLGEPSDKKIRPTQALSDAGRSAEVVAALTPQFMQTLRGTDLRQAYVLLGDNLALLERLDHALSVYQIGTGLFPKNVDLLTRQAGLLHRTGLDEQAKPLYQKALKLEPRHFGAQRGLAEIETSLGFLDRAAAHYEIALESLEKNADLWRDYSQVLLALGELKTAEMALGRARALEPDNVQSLILLAFLLRAKGDYSGAVVKLDEALAHGADVGARRARALWLLEAGRSAEALAETGKVLALVPGDAASLWVRARVSLAAGDPVKAYDDLTLASGETSGAGFSSRAARALRAGVKAIQDARFLGSHRR